MSSFCLDAALLLMCSTCAFTVLVAALWCGWLHHLWFHPISAACGGSLLLGVWLWGGAEAKAFGCLLADYGDILGRRFPPWRHHSIVPSPFNILGHHFPPWRHHSIPPSPFVPPWLVAWSVVHPLYLHCFISTLSSWLSWSWRMMLCRNFSTLVDVLPPWSCYSVDASHCFVLRAYSPLAS